MSIEVEIQFKSKLDEPKMFLVYMLNDDYTSWEFCVRILMSVFHKTLKEADDTTHNIHTQGKGLCGIYTHEIAETKAEMVEQKAKEEGFPMKCSIQEQ